MIQTHRFEGTVEEITTQLQRNYAGQKLRVFVEPEIAEADGIGQPTPNHPLAAVIGSFRDSVFFEEVIENIKARREEERNQYVQGHE